MQPKHSSEFSQKPATEHCMENLNSVHTRPPGVRSTFIVSLHLLLVFRIVLSHQFCWLKFLSLWIFHVSVICFMSSFIWLITQLIPQLWENWNIDDSHYIIFPPTCKSFYDCSYSLGITAHSEMAFGGNHLHWWVMSRLYVTKSLHSAQ
jgi:hypothetical protein